MSATGRGAERREADFYPTPAWCVHRLLDHVELPGGNWLEPGAGDGAIIRAVNFNRDDVEWTALELREECRKPLLALGAVVGCPKDFLRTESARRNYAVALGNPPYLLAAEFIWNALAQSDQAIFLLRLNFLEGRGRRGLFESIGAPDVFVLPERPSFDGEGTDACAYAWMRWRQGGTQEGRVSILYEKRQLSLLPEVKP